MKKRGLLRAGMMLLCILLMGCLGGCKDSDRGKVVFTTSLAKDELFRIDQVSCTLPEYMLYLVNTQNKYEEVFGKEIWEVSFEGITLEDNVKDNVLAKIARMKSVYLLAKQKEIILTDQEEKLLEQAAKQYFSSLTKAEVEAIGVTEEVVLQLYRENALADKVYRQIIAGVNPEISDDEARTVTVEQILLRTCTKDAEGNEIAYSEAMKAEALDRIKFIREKAVSGEQGFTELAGRYSEEENLRISLKKGEADAALEEVVFSLQTDEISEVVETADGYYLLKCISTFDKAQTDANKLVLVEKRKNEAFSKEYDAFVENKARKLNEKLWQQIELNQTPGVGTTSFFEVYEECLQNF